VDLTNLSSLKNLLASYKIYPTKSKGQNFLINKKVLGEIIKAADLEKDDLVLEVGPGIGVLTQELASRVKKVLAVELDKKLIKVLTSTLADFENVEILAGDILKIKNQELAEKLGGPASPDGSLGGDYKVVANLPYNITGQLLKKFLTYQPRPREMTLMLQREVAERIIAKPGKMSLLAVSVQVYSQPKLVNLVNKKSFYPQPEVDSAILKISNINDDLFSQAGIEEGRFWQLVKISFSSRRKQLKNNLAVGFQLSKDQVESSLIKAKINPLARAQELDIDQWLRLSKVL